MMQVTMQVEPMRGGSPSRPIRRWNSFSSFGPIPDRAGNGAKSGLSTDGRIELPLTFNSSPSIYASPGRVRAFGVGVLL